MIWKDTLQNLKFKNKKKYAIVEEYHPYSHRMFKKDLLVALDSCYFKA